MLHRTARERRAGLHGAGEQVRNAPERHAGRDRLGAYGGDPPRGRGRSSPRRRRSTPSAPAGGSPMPPRCCRTDYAVVLVRVRLGSGLQRTASNGLNGRGRRAGNCGRSSRQSLGGRGARGLRVARPDGTAARGRTEREMGRLRGRSSRLGRWSTPRRLELTPNGFRRPGHRCRSKFIFLCDARRHQLARRTGSGPPRHPRGVRGNCTRHGADTQQVGTASSCALSANAGLDLPPLIAAMLRAAEPVVPELLGLPPPAA